MQENNSGENQDQPRTVLPSSDVASQSRGRQRRGTRAPSNERLRNEVLPRESRSNTASVRERPSEGARSIECLSNIAPMDRGVPHGAPSSSPAPGSMLPVIANPIYVPYVLASEFLLIRVEG